MKLGLRELTFFLLLAGIPCAAFVFYFWPHARHMAQVRVETTDKQARLAQLDRLGQTSEQLTSELRELAKALEFFESKLPSDQQIHRVLGEVTQITERYGLTTRSVRTLKQNATADYVDQPIELELAGPFEGVYQFLLDLEKLPRITRISQLELSKEKTPDGEGSVKAQMVMSIYFEPGAEGSPRLAGR